MHLLQSYASQSLQDSLLFLGSFSFPLSLNVRFCFHIRACEASGGCELRGTTKDSAHKPDLTWFTQSHCSYRINVWDHVLYQMLSLWPSLLQCIFSISLSVSLWRLLPEFFTDLLCYVAPSSLVNTGHVFSLSLFHRCCIHTGRQVVNNKTPTMHAHTHTHHTQYKRLKGSTLRLIFDKLA